MSRKLPRQSRQPTWVTYSGMGIELAAAVVGFTLVGWWLDRHFGWSPWGVLAGVLLGLTGGTYNLVRSALAAVRGEPDPEAGEDETNGV